MIGDLLPIACSTHLGESLAFGAPPIVMIVALVVITCGVGEPTPARTARP